MVNRAVGLSAQIDKTIKDLKQVKRQFLLEVAGNLTKLSPVDTGDYVMSHQVSDTSIAGRFTGNFRSIGPGGQNKEFFQETAYNKLAWEIDALPETTTTVFFGNTSPHALSVEFGKAVNKNWRHDGYHVYQITKTEANNLLKTAVAKVKGS